MHRVRQFIDKPCQSRKCYNLTHSKVKCSTYNKICVTCGESHEGRAPPRLNVQIVKVPTGQILTNA